MFNFFKKTDSDIQEDVINEIKWDQSVTASGVAVTVNDGIVTLRGGVPHYYEKLQAENAAQRVGGVRAVLNEIEVDLMGSHSRSDEQIAEAALSALAWSYLIPKDLKVTVEKGWITLKGETEWDYQRTAAKDAVSHLMGVRGVSNYIFIKPSEDSILKAEDIKTRIESALKRTAKSEASKITVSVAGNRAILTGDVHSINESQDARNAAWMAPGIYKVENNLRIG